MTLDYLDFGRAQCSEALPCVHAPLVLLINQYYQYYQLNNYFP